MSKIRSLVYRNLKPILSLNKVLRIFVESLIWLVSAFLGSFIRFDGNIPQKNLKDIFLLGIISATLNFINNIFFAVYKTQLIKASFEETIRIGVSIFTTTLILFAIRIYFDFPNLPRLTPILCGMIFLILQLILRILLSGRLTRIFINERSGIKTLIYGSGITGQQIVNEMLSGECLYDPIGFLDDNQNKQNFMYRGRKVLGTLDVLENVVERFKPEILVIAITQISPKNLIILERRCKKLGISTRIIPNVIEIMKKNLKLADITDMAIEDILGRPQVIYDTTELLKFLSGKKILVTGAGGSIGSEIARQLSKIKGTELFLLDRNENSLLELCLSINGDGLFAQNNVILCDIRDKLRVQEVISELKPNIVFHAAALKHLALLEKFPSEAYKTNVISTKNLIEVCLQNSVKYFINISTDKAVEPVSELGKTKYLSERIISGVDSSEKIYISVRFGNVVGSNGSFLNTFREQIKFGGPVTVTHPEVTRYFMSIEEAVYLVLQATLVAKCGETLILDMGEPVSINDVAQKLIADSGIPIEIEYTGLRKGEKLHEKLTSSSEIVYSGGHQNILHTKVPPLDAL